MNDAAGDDGLYGYRTVGWPTTATFSNLAAGLYQVEVVSLSHTGATSDIQVQGSFADGNYRDIAGVTGDNFDAWADGRNTSNWLTWSEVAPDGSDEITVSFDFISGSNPMLNALRVTTVPEPGTAVMAALALVGITMRRRRKRA